MPLFPALPILCIPLRSFHVENEPHRTPLFPGGSWSRSSVCGQMLRPDAFAVQSEGNAALSKSFWNVSKLCSTMFNMAYPHVAIYYKWLLIPSRSSCCFSSAHALCRRSKCSTHFLDLFRMLIVKQVIVVQRTLADPVIERVAPTLQNIVHRHWSRSTGIRLYMFL